MEGFVRSEAPPFIEWLHHYWIVAAFVIIAAVMIRAYWPSQKFKHEMDRRAAIPLDDDP